MRLAELFRHSLLGRIRVEILSLHHRANLRPVVFIIESISQYILCCPLLHARRAAIDAPGIKGASFVLLHQSSPSEEAIVGIRRRG